MNVDKIGNSVILLQKMYIKIDQQWWPEIEI